jgi:hypothetical protein
VHQQAINEPFVTLEKAEQYDVIARLHGGGISGQAGRCASASPGPSSRSSPTTARPSRRRAS